MAISAIILAQLQDVANALKSSGLSWFDDNPLAWEGPSRLALGVGNPLSQWDAINIMGYDFVGEVRGKVGTKLDIKERAGKNGATLTMNGQRNTSVDIKLYIFTPFDLANYTAMINQAFARSNSVSQTTNVKIINGQASATQSAIPHAITVLTPKLQLHNATALYLFEAELIELPKSGEPAHVTLHFHLFLANQPKQKISGTINYSTQVFPGGTTAPQGPQKPPTPHPPLP